MKINEVDKVTTLATGECITAIAEDGSLIQIPVSELGKVMSQVIPVATGEKNGLMSRINAIKSYKLKPGEELEVISSNYCLLLIKNASSGRTSLLLSGHMSIDIIYTYGDIGTGINEKSLIVYKKEAGGSCFIKNNSNSDITGLFIMM